MYINANHCRKGDVVAKRKYVTRLGRWLNPDALSIGVPAVENILSEFEMKLLEQLPDEMIIRLIRLLREKHLDAVYRIEEAELQEFDNRAQGAQVRRPALNRPE